MDETRKDIIRKLETDDYLPEEVIAEIKRLLAALDAAEQRVKELDLANYDVTQNNRGLWDELTVAEQRAAEAEVLISQLLDPNQNEFTIEKTFLALKKWLEEHGPHEHG